MFTFGTGRLSQLIFASRFHGTPASQASPATGVPLRIAQNLSFTSAYYKYPKANEQTWKPNFPEGKTGHDPTWKQPSR
jgi:hypothetical protein